mgnify:CR=1 FL=1
MPSNTYTLIASLTVGAGGASSIDFTSIPSTYTDLLVKLSGRSSTGYNAADFYLQFNGSASGYSGRYLMKDSSDPTPVSSTSQTSKFLLGLIPATQATANVFGSAEIYIPNYAGSTNKSISVDSATENNGTIQWIYFAGGLWSNSSAITQVTLIDATGTFAQYSTAYLYGVKNA